MFALLLAAVVSIAAQAIDHRPPGRLVDVGGRSLHVHCTGYGSPTVVLEAGASSFAIDWALVQPVVAETHRVCSYDRAGHGWSNPRPIPAGDYTVSIDPVARDLEAALAAAGERPPYVLVGASRGSIFVRLFQNAFPEQVMGIVLVDGAHENGLFILRDGNPVQIASLSAREYMAAVSPFGSPSRGREARLQAPHRRLSAELQEVRLWLEARFLRAIESATARDIEAFHIEQHHALSTLHRIDTSGAHPLGDLPLVVLARGEGNNDRRMAFQVDLARLSRNSRLTVVEDSGHEIHLFRPDMVVAAIRTVSEAGVDGTELRRNDSGRRP